MIAVDTSALLAVLLDEPQSDACIAALASSERNVISASTLAEALIVAHRRNVTEQLLRILERLDWDIIETTAETARRVADAHTKWGRGSHPAALNFGDCFSYDVAKDRNLPLLFVGNDFARTDLRSVLECTQKNAARNWAAFVVGRAEGDA